VTYQETARFFQTAWEAIHAAGALIRDNWQGPKAISYKGSIDLVTSVDRDAERCIVDLLRRSFPKHAILAEEETTAASHQNSYREKIVLSQRTFRPPRTPRLRGAYSSCSNPQSEFRNSSRRTPRLCGKDRFL
jgi:3'-phosphoadenosine 5'-phosphosulfate (PAPS) 3'-phosphatase